VKLLSLYFLGEAHPAVKVSKMRKMHMNLFSAFLISNEDIPSENSNKRKEYRFHFELVLYRFGENRQNINTHFKRLQRL
jgi:hypothetical protein